MSRSLRTVPSLLRLSSRTRAIGSPAVVLSSSATCLPPRMPQRPFSNTPIVHKKSGKANLSHAKSDSSPPISTAAPSTPTDQAFDFGPLEASILKAIEKLTHDLAQLRSGGRFDPAVLDGLKVAIGPHPKQASKGKDKGADPYGPKATVRLSEIAQVVPKGRQVLVVVGEAEHVKPVTTAIQASGHNLNPLPPSAEAPTTLVVPVPPPTGESRQRALDAASEAALRADRAVHDARAAHQKRLRGFQKEKSVLPDDLNRAHKEMEDIVKRGHAEIKRIVEAAKKVLASADRH